MAYLLKLLYGQYNYVMNDLSDPRTEDWFMVLSVEKLVAVMFIWLWFVRDVGPKWMQSRQPFNLNAIMIVYNLFQIIYCSILLYLSYDIALFQYSWTCEQVDYTTSKTAMKVASLVWGFYLLKIIDLLDTVFFVLRKKQNQLTFLHIYHHFGMVFSIYVGVKWFAGGQVIFLGFFNCIVHVVMYFYYLLSALKKEYKKSAWWKKHITQLQLVQFILNLLFYTPNLFMASCPLPKFIFLFIVTQNIVMLLLFSDFYYKTYIRKREPLQHKTLENANKMQNKNNKFEPIGTNVHIDVRNNVRKR